MGKGTSYIMDNAAAKLKKKRMTKFEVKKTAFVEQPFIEDVFVEPGSVHLEPIPWWDPKKPNTALLSRVTRLVGAAS